MKVVALLLFALMASQTQSAPLAHAPDSQPAAATASTPADLEWKLVVTDIPGDPRPAALIPQPEGGVYLLGTTGWRDNDADRTFRSARWMLDVGPNGQRRGFHQFAPDRDIQTVIGTLLERDIIALAFEFHGPAHQCHLWRISPAGGLASEHTVGGDVPHNLFSLGSNRFLVSGTRLGGLEGTPDGWLAEIDALGQIKWQRTFDRGHHESVYGLLPLPDDGCVLALTSGDYNKFGHGPGLLWLVRCAARGEKLAEAMIPDGQILSAGSSLAPFGAGVAVGYSTTQLPNICGKIDFSKPFAFDMRVAIFDAELNRVRDVELPSSPWITTPALAALPDGGLLAVTGAENGVRLIPISSAGKTGEPRTVQVESGFLLSRVSMQSGAVTVVGTRMPRESATEHGPKADVVVARIRY